MHAEGTVHKSGYSHFPQYSGSPRFFAYLVFKSDIVIL